MSQSSWNDTRVLHLHKHDPDCYSSVTCESFAVCECTQVKYCKRNQLWFRRNGQTVALHEVLNMTLVHPSLTLNPVVLTVWSFWCNWVNYWPRNKGLVICFKRACYLCMSSILPWLFFLVKFSIRDQAEKNKTMKKCAKRREADGKMKNWAVCS